MSLEPFNRLVRLAARAFYDDITMKGDNQPKTGRGDNRGMAVVVLDALTRRQWVREEDLAKALKLHSKQLRRTLRFFEEEKLVTRDHRKEIYDVVRYRIHRMKKKLKDELDSRNTIQEYICPNCGRRFSAFDALQLWSQNDEYFHCENCNAELVAESDKLAAEEMGEGDDNARRHRREKLKDMLQKVEEQLKPLTSQLARVKDSPIPEFGTLQAWEARANVAARLNGDSNANDSSKSSQAQGYGGTPMPFLGETKVEVALAGVEAKEESTETDTKAASMKVLPPWMIKQGMNLTKEQRGEVKAEPKIDEISQPADEKKPKAESEDEKSIQDEYLKAYYAALVKRQEEQAAASNRIMQAENNNASTSYLSNGVSEAPSGRQVGMKANREVDENDDVEWEDAPPAGKTFKVADLNVQADADEPADEEEEDDIDWEEG